MKLACTQKSISCEFGPILKRQSLELNRSNLTESIESLDPKRLRQFEKKLLGSSDGTWLDARRDLRALARKKVKESLELRSKLEGGPICEIDANAIKITRLNRESKVEKVEIDLAKMASSGAAAPVSNEEMLAIFRQAAYLPKQRKADAKSLVQSLNLFLEAARSRTASERNGIDKLITGLFGGTAIAYVAPKAVSALGLARGAATGIAVAAALIAVSLVSNLVERSGKKKAMREIAERAAEAVSRLSA